MLRFQLRAFGGGGVEGQRETFDFGVYAPFRTAGFAEILRQYGGIDARSDFARSGIGIGQAQIRRDGNVLRRFE